LTDDLTYNHYDSIIRTNWGLMVCVQESQVNIPVL